MKSSHRVKVLQGISVLTLFFAAALLQGCITVKCEDCDKPCEEGVTPGGVGQGNCFKHRAGTWRSDPSACTSGYVCNNPGGQCSNTAVTGTCTLEPTSGKCDCRCK